MRKGHYLIKFREKHSLYELASFIEDLNAYLENKRYRIINDFDIEREEDKLKFSREADYEREKKTMEGYYELDIELPNDKLPEDNEKASFKKLATKYFVENEIKIIDFKL